MGTEMLITPLVFHKSSVRDTKKYLPKKISVPLLKKKRYFIIISVCRQERKTMEHRQKHPLPLKKKIPLEEIKFLHAPEIFNFLPERGEFDLIGDFDGVQLLVERAPVLEQTLDLLLQVGDDAAAGAAEFLLVGVVLDGHAHHGHRQQRENKNSHCHSDQNHLCENI